MDVDVDFERCDTHQDVHVDGDQFSQVVRIYTPVCDESLRPKIGMWFVTLEDGIAFYKFYAKAAGFSARLSTIKHANDKSVAIRYILCSREGKKDSAAPGESGRPKRKRASSRIGCCARVAFKAEAPSGFVIYKFTEGHNHELVSTGYRRLMKENRQLDAGQQLFLAKCAKASVGAAKCYRIYKQFADDVGPTKIDFKNMARDIKSYAIGIDSELLLQKLGRLKAKDERFFFAYEKEEDNDLYRLFWADPAAIQNYKIFGDAVSFDATYNTNKYCMIFAPFTGQDNHGRCVNFGAGLLAREDTDCYSWLFTKFVECMGHAPKMVITDQDLGMRAAIEKVLPNTRHRFCMWHITKKLAEKLPVPLRGSDGFINEFSQIVWTDDDEPPVFETKWNNLISKYSLDGNKWFSDMYAMRTFWIPAFFRETEMSGLFRTTSLSECENSFFRRYLSKHSNLSDMFMMFEIAIESQREDHDSLTLADQTKSLDMITRLEIERDAARVYTNSKLADVQTEIEMSVMFCIAGEGISESDQVLYEVGEDAVGLFKVVVVPNEKTISCQCGMFIRCGLLCRHIFAVFKVLKWKTIPEKYILSRWTKKACSVFDSVGQNSYSLGSKERKDPKKDLFALACKSMAIAEGDDELTQELGDLISKFIESHAGDESNMNASQRKQKVIEQYYGSKVPSTISIGDPKTRRTKGSCSRLKSRMEAEYEKQKKPERLCRKCNTRGHHDSRNCKMPVMQ